MNATKIIPSIGRPYPQQDMAHDNEAPASVKSTCSDDLRDEEHFQTEEEQRDELKEVHKLAQRETNHIAIWKAVLLVTILLAAASVTAGTYRILSNAEGDNFNAAYDHFANTVQDRIEFHFSKFRLATSSMANAIAGSAAALNQTFPFVTLYDFEVHGQEVRAQTGIEVFSFAPYVRPDQSEEWSAYTMAHADWWIQQSRKTVLKSAGGKLKLSSYRDGSITPAISGFDGEGNFLPLSEPIAPRTTYVPIWQQSPPFFANWVVNIEWTQQEQANQGAAAMEKLRQVVMSEIMDVSFIANSAITYEDHEAFHANLVNWRKDGSSSTFEHPHSFTTIPINQEVNDNTSEIVGQLQGSVAWDYYLVGLLPEGVRGLTVILENSCNQAFTYELDGNSALYRGAKDLHDRKYNHFRREVHFYYFPDQAEAFETEGHCMFTFAIYPTSEFEDKYKTRLPIILAVVVGATFFLMIMAFFMYDWFVQSRNKKVAMQAARATGIVSSMFPGQIRDQLLKEKELKEENKSKNPFATSQVNKQRPEGDAICRATNQLAAIADFYPDCTIMFADIVGFTAWASVREPTQVFQLLETVYAEFDKIAKQRRVFKVETVGDCYVAVVGLPDPRKDHVVVISRFARDCQNCLRNLLPKLEVTLGPDTTDLTMRIGLHSGAVTAGVLRGDRARFQLFGDTMNTASRMESTGMPDKIQVSQETAELLKAAGKGNWLSPRNELIEVKGKGQMQTWWLTATASREDSSVTNGSLSGTSTTTSADGGVQDKKKIDTLPVMIQTKKERKNFSKIDRLVEWNFEVLLKLLCQVEAQRGPQESSCAKERQEATVPTLEMGSGTPLEEVKEVVPFPDFNEFGPVREPHSIEFGEEVKFQLRDYVTMVAEMYRNNAFHNFEHASHVAMATVKLLSRVVNPKIDGNVSGNSPALHDFTYGITSDPLTQFACVFSALIHDIDHAGVPNSRLKVENPDLANVYKRSLAEQNSFDLAWKLFQSDSCASLRRALCRTPEELRHFRQVVINVVLATDIMDKDLAKFRNARWEKAFGAKADLEEAQKYKIDRKAMIVIEHLIQASDVAHTMQHWHIYRKWNGRLFTEMYEAYLDGRADVDPSVNWYEGELGFFDFYVIPLAKKLAQCNVFGVSSSEYLDYAMRNRVEWDNRGRDVVAELLQEAKAARQKKMMEIENLEEEDGDDGPEGNRVAL